MSKLTITCTEFEPFTRNTLRGFATIVIAELKLEIREVSVHEHERGARWAHPPSRAVIDKDGIARRDTESGRIKYVNMFEFTDKATREAFSRAVIDALLRAFPNAFATGEEVA